MQRTKRRKNKTNICKLKEEKKQRQNKTKQINKTNIERTVCTEDNKIRKSHRVAMRTEWRVSENMATPGNKRTRLRVSSSNVHPCPINPK